MIRRAKIFEGRNFPSKSFQTKFYNVRHVIEIMVPAQPGTFADLIGGGCLLFAVAMATSEVVECIGFVLDRLLSSEMQHCTQVYGRRPYGVGMLVAGCDVS